MQLARNLFLSSEKSYGRKIQEIFLSVQIERGLPRSRSSSFMRTRFIWVMGLMGSSRVRILLYKKAKDLTLTEAALLAALPKGPEGYSPLKYPDRALRRRNLVLSEMLDDARSRSSRRMRRRLRRWDCIWSAGNSVAPYFVEEVRRQLERQYGVEQVHGAGLRVYTTLDLDLQMVANKAILEGTATTNGGMDGRKDCRMLCSKGRILELPPSGLVQPLDKGSYVQALSRRRRREGSRQGWCRSPVVLTPEDGSGPRTRMATAFCVRAMWFT